MTDHFALLGEARRPWLDPERIRDTFHRLGREQHPDAATGGPGTGDGDDFARLNQAQATLGDPRTRLRHLLELEYPDMRVAGPSVVPPVLADLFAPVLTLVRDADDLLAKKAAPSALARALLARQEFALRETAETLLARLEALHDAAREELHAFDAAWERGRPADAAARLVEFHGRFAYLSRWTEQLRERLFLLGM